MHSGEEVEAVRVKNLTLKRALQSAADLAANRRRRKRIRKKLKRIGDREARFRRNTNHTLSKRLVAKAKDTGRGIALEDLKGIRDRIRFSQAATEPRRLLGIRISFASLSAIRLSKLASCSRSSTPSTPLGCVPECGHVERGNRSSQSRFCCKQCGHSAHADYNAARNIRARASVNAPKVSPAPALAAG